MPYTAALRSIFDRGMTPSRDCIAVCFGSVSYGKALDLQMRISEAKKRGFDKDVLLLLEHPPTITLGRNASEKNLLVNRSFLKTKGVDLFQVDRGGDITFHGPGQLVGYPILALQGGERDVHAYMRNLEASLIRLLSSYGVTAERDPRYTGVWTATGKIAAMGVHISRWITRHGFALNVNTDLSFYDWIVPCGIVGKAVTSMQKLLERPVQMGDVAERYIPEFSAVFRRSMLRMSEEELLDALPSGIEDSAELEACDKTVG